MKHKVGDKVKIKSLEWYNENKNDIGNIELSIDPFLPEMSKFCGEEAVIKSVEHMFYDLYIDGGEYSWTDDMFEDEEPNIKEDLDTKTDNKVEEIIENMNNNIFEYKENSILSEAQTILDGNRQADYGDAVENFKNIAKCASEWSGKELTALDCVNVMIAVKTKREQFKHKRDNLVDLAAYLEIREKIIEDFSK